MLSSLFIYIGKIVEHQIQHEGAREVTFGETIELVAELNARYEADKRAAVTRAASSPRRL